MAADTTSMNLHGDSIVERLTSADDQAEHAAILRSMLQDRYLDADTLWALAERIKDEADRARYQDTARSLQWSDTMATLGHIARQPTIVALARMTEGLTFYEQGRYTQSLASFDEASDTFSAYDHDLGWARTQIGRTAPCMALARFDEALERAATARQILERAGDQLRAACLDTNISALLERMNRPSEALIYSQRALDTYRPTGSSYYMFHVLSNHALLLWRVGHVRASLDAYLESRAGYLELNAQVDAAREDLNVGAVYLALGRFAESISTLTSARKALIAGQTAYWAAVCSLYLAEACVHMGRYAEAIQYAEAAGEELFRHQDVLWRAQALTWQALALAGTRRISAALIILDRARELLSTCEGIDAHVARLDVVRAQFLQQLAQPAEARELLDASISSLRHAGLSTDAAAAALQLGWIHLREGNLVQARDVAAQALAMAEPEGLDWLSSRALHLRGRVDMQAGSDESAAQSFGSAIRQLDRVRRRVAWDDSAGFAHTTLAIFEDAVGLALRRGRSGLALKYAERAKASALADHVLGGIQVRPRIRDRASRDLIEELSTLRERHAWLDVAARGQAALLEQPSASVRGCTPWAEIPERDPAARQKIAGIERRMAEIWRELQASNPAYRGEAAALDIRAAADASAAAADADEVCADADGWIHGVQAALGSDAALLEYAAIGEDLVAFVVRGGAVRCVQLVGAVAELHRLVPLLRLNVERSARAVLHDRGGGGLAALDANMRGILARLHTLLLAPIVSLIDGAVRLVIVPHGPSHHVPFHALYDAAHQGTHPGGRFLIERCEVSYVPCASLIEHFEARHRILAGLPDQSKRSKGSKRSLGEALVLACSADGALPHATTEGIAVAAALDGRLLDGAAATNAALRRLSGTANVIHVAAHGVFRPDEPLFSSLILSDGRLSTLDVFDLELNCSLVTLSACETALGTDGAGDELMGLSRAFLYAGAASLVLSLWKVEDAATASLMTLFYRALRDGKSKGAALREAQLALLNDGLPGPGHHAPFFWAPFCLVGHAGPLATPTPIGSPPVSWDRAHATLA